jgi:putative transposase
MPQSHARILVHLVFSTRSRDESLTPDIQPEVFSYLAGILRGEGHAPISVGGHVDHVHMLFGLGRTQSIAKLVEKLKTSSSVWHIAKRNHGCRFVYSKPGGPPFKGIVSGGISQNLPGIRS